MLMNLIKQCVGKRGNWVANSSRLNFGWTIESCSIIKPCLCFSFSCKKSLGQTCIGRVRPNILWDADIAGAKPRCNQCVESLSFLSVQLIIDPKNKTFPSPKCCPNNGVQREKPLIISDRVTRDTKGVYTYNNNTHQAGDGDFFGARKWENVHDKSTLQGG